MLLLLSVSPTGGKYWISKWDLLDCKCFLACSSQEYLVWPTLVFENWIKQVTITHRTEQFCIISLVKNYCLLIENSLPAFSLSECSCWSTCTFNSTSKLLETELAKSSLFPGIVYFWTGLFVCISREEELERVNSFERCYLWSNPPNKTQCLACSTAWWVFFWSHNYALLWQNIFSTMAYPFFLPSFLPFNQPIMREWTSNLQKPVFKQW